MRIIKELLEDNTVSVTAPTIRKSYRSIARGLKVDPGTVRHRMERLKDSGVLNGWWVGINPNLTGQQVSQLWFDLPIRSKKDMIRKISLVPGVALIEDFLGRAVSVILYHQGGKPFEKIVNLLVELTGAENVMAGRKIFPSCDIAMKKEDWSILKILGTAPGTEYSVIAKQLRLSGKTVKRRIARMSQSGAIYLLAKIDPAAVEGNLLVDLAVFYESKESRDILTPSLLNYLKDEMAFSDVEDSEHGYFALMLNGVRRLEEIRSWMEEQSGVKVFRLDVLEDMISLYEPYANQIESALDESAG